MEIISGTLSSGESQLTKDKTVGVILKYTDIFLRSLIIETKRYVYYFNQIIVAEWPGRVHFRCFELVFDIFGWTLLLKSKPTFFANIVYNWRLFP